MRSTSLVSMTGVAFALLIIISSLTVRTVDGSTHAERELARKLIKLFLAAAVLSPPGLGVFPVPLPLPVPFGIETLKPPIYAPFGFPFIHGGGFGGGGLGGYGGGIAAAASEISPVIALPVVKAGSALANAAGTKIPVTLPRIQQQQQQQQQVSFVTPQPTPISLFNLNGLSSNNNNNNNNNNGNNNGNNFNNNNNNNNHQQQMINPHPNHQPNHQPNFMQQAKTLSHVLSLIQPTPNPPSGFLFGRRRR